MLASDREVKIVEEKEGELAAARDEAAQKDKELQGVTAKLKAYEENAQKVRDSRSALLADQLCVGLLAALRSRRTQRS